MTSREPRMRNQRRSTSSDTARRGDYPSEYRATEERVRPARRSNPNMNNNQYREAPAPRRDEYQNENYGSRNQADMRSRAPEGQYYDDYEYRGDGYSNSTYGGRQYANNQRMMNEGRGYSSEYDNYYYPPEREYPNSRANYIPRNRYDLPPEPKENNTLGKQIFKIVYNVVFYVVTIGVLMTAIMYGFSGRQNASLFGYSFFSALTDSMVSADGFNSGDVLIVKEASYDDVEVGDIVTFSVGEEGSYLTHRLVEKDTQVENNDDDTVYITTKGDANESNDPPIDSERILGKTVFVIPKIGQILEYVNSSSQTFISCVLLVISVFGFLMVFKAYIMEPGK